MADTRGIRAGRAFVELGVSDKLSAGLRRAQKRLEAFGQGLRAIGTRLAGIGVTAVTGLLAGVKHFSDAGDALDKMSVRTGVSVEALSELGFAAEQSGADLDSLETGLKHMQKSVVEAARGSETAQKALSLLGLSVQDLAGLSPEQQFKLLADRIAAVRDPALRTALALEIFGKSGTKLLPLLAEGARGIETLQEQARALGLTVSTQTAKDAALLNDTLNILWRVLKQGVFTIGSALAPTIVDLSNAITRVVVTATNWVKQNKVLVVNALKIAAGVAVAGAAIIALGAAVSGIGAALGALAGIIAGIGTAFGLVATVIGALLSPIGLVVAAVVGLGGALLVASGAGGQALDWLMAQFTRLRDWVGKVVGGIADALSAGDIALAAQILWLSLKVIWQQGVAALNKAWLGAKEFFVSTAYSMWYGALAAAETVFHALEVAWIETTSFLSKTWTRFTSGFQKVWETASSWVAKRMLEIQGIFDSGLDVEAAKQAVDQQLDARLSEIDQGSQQDLAAREQRRASERDQAAHVHDATMAKIGQDFEDAQAALRSKTDDQVAESQRELDAAKRRLDAAVAEARAKREAADQEGGPPRPIGDLLSQFEDQVGGLGDLLAKGISVRGTFSAAAAPGLGAGSEAAERTARATEQTARNTKRLVDAASAGGLTFG
jgi:hypothetical protein